MLKAKYHPQGFQIDIEVSEPFTDKNGNTTELVQRATYVLPVALLHCLKPLAPVPAEELKPEKKSE